MNFKNKYLGLAIFSMMIASGMLQFFDLRMPVLAEGSGNTIGFVGYGAFTNGVNLTNITEPLNISQTANWTYIEDRDYISFRDSTTEAGFRFKLYMSSTALGDFVYSGFSNSQTDIDVSNFKIWANYISQTYVQADKGVDDTTKVLSILSAASCPDAQTLSHYTFNEAFLSATTDYGITASSSMQPYLTSDLSCEVEGRLDIRRMELLFPPSSREGTYTSYLMILLIDGQET